jgi:Spy/CpxP family protein refolding chaperone
MKYRLWPAVAVLLAAVIVTIPLFAQASQGPGRHGGPFGMRGGPFPILRGLDLTDDQRQQIRTIGESARSNGGTLHQKLGDLQSQLQLAVFADTPDTQKIQELKGQIASAMAEELDARIAVETRMAAVLTPEQRAQARERVEKRGKGN